MEINHINNLRKELNDIIDLNEGLKTNILNIFTSWYSCKSKHSYITSINDSVINLNKKININGVISNYFYGSDDILPEVQEDKIEDINKITLFIENCNNCEIIITEKFNHLILLNCNNIKLFINSGMISGIDIIHSEYINIKVQFNKIYTANFQNCRYCSISFGTGSLIQEYDDNYLLSGTEDNSFENTKIITYCCYDINFYLINNDKFKKFNTNTSLFSGIIYFTINKNLTVDYVDKYGSGNLISY